MKRICFSKKQWVLGAACLGFALASLLFFLLLGSIRSALPTLRAAEEWAGESELPFTQLACYLSYESKPKEAAITQFRKTLSDRLLTAAIEGSEDTTLFRDAYCGEGSLTVAGNKASASVTAAGVGGDFFRFHPLSLLSGSTISDRDLMDDRVVLSEALAWKLFGGSDLAGLSVTIGGKSFFVAGVVSLEDDRFSRLARSSEEMLFLSYSALSELLGEEPGIDCYEIVMPNPIRDYGSALLGEIFPLGGGTLVENTGRYDWENLWQIFRNGAKRSMVQSPVCYPYWENALRVAESRAALFWFLALLCAAFPCAVLLVLGIRMGMRLWKRAKTEGKRRLAERVERRREAKWESEQERWCADDGERDF